MKYLKNLQILFVIGSILVLLGAVMHLFHNFLSPYIYSAGSLSIIALHAINALKVDEENFRHRRVARMWFVCSLFLVISCYFMFKGSNSWVAFLLIYALTSFFLSFRTE